jgi:hypothetical protein
MSLKFRVDRFDELPNDIQPFYNIQQDGSGILDAEDATEAIKKERRRSDAYNETVLAACLAFDVAPALLLPAIKPYLKTEEEKGRFVVRVTDGKGTVRLGDAQGNPMSVPQFLAELKADPHYAGAFRERESDDKKQQKRGDVRTIDAKDSAAFMANLSDIAKGKVVVAA